MTQSDDLKLGNPALTDECVQYGLRRASEIVAKHAAAGTEAFRKRYPGCVHLAEIQLAAVLAEAYREGRADKRDISPLWQAES